MNQFLVLDENYELDAIIDDYKSVIWAERFYENGDFEIYCPNNSYNYNALSVVTVWNTPRFIMRADDHTKVGIITDVQYVHSVDDGDMIICKGKTDDYLLHYRVIYEQSTYVGNYEYAVRHMVRNALIDSESHITARQMSNFKLGAWATINDNVQLQFQGDYLDEAISKLSKERGYGYQIDFDPENNDFVFKVVKSMVRPEIIFSTALDNLLSSEYNIGSVPNTVYAIGEGTGANKYVGVYDVYASQSGINRKEFYVNAEKVSTNAESFNALTYENLLRNRAKESFWDKFKNNETTKSSVAPNSYKLGIDYWLGDVVKVVIDAGDQGHEKKVLSQKIIETVECWDENGYTCEPTFEAVEG